MNILHVTPYFAPAWAYGGPPRIISDLSRQQVRRGHSVTVLTTDACGPANRTEQSTENVEGVEVRRLKNLSNSLAWRQQVFLPRGTGAFLQRRLRDFDIVHLHLFRTLQNVVAHRWAVREGIPYVLAAHGTVPRIVRRRSTKALFDVVFGERLLRDAKTLVAVSQTEKSQYKTVGVPSTKISVSFNGINPRPYENLPPPGGFAQRYRLGNRRLVSYVGRLNARKGLEYLLLAFRDLMENIGDVQLVFVGPDDGYRSRLEALTNQLAITDHVLFTGMVTESEKLEVLVDSDLVVYPSQHEVFGLVPFEALLCGKPVVVANDSGCGEIIESAGAGLTVPFGDIKELQNAMRISLENGRGITDRVLRGQRFVLEQLNWDQIAERFEEIYGNAKSTVSLPH